MVDVQVKPRPLPAEVVRPFPPPPCYKPTAEKTDNLLRLANKTPRTPEALKMADTCFAETWAETMTTIEKELLGIYGGDAENPKEIVDRESN